MEILDQKRTGRTGLGQYNGHGESSVSIGKVFKLCQENATTGNSSSPPRDWFSREIPVKGLSDQLNVPCCTLRRWAAEYEADGEDAFPGSGNPAANKDYEMLKLKKENEELRKEVAILKKSGPS